MEIALQKKPIPLSFTNHFNTGCRLQREGQLERAEEYFAKAAKECPEAWLGLACKLQQEGSRAEAVLRFVQVYEAAPDSKAKLKSIAANNIGTILSDKGHSAEAEKYFRASDKLWRNSDALANLALIAKYNGRTTEALRLVNKSLRMNPRQPQAWFTKALLQLLIGEYAEGWRNYESRWSNPKSELEKLAVLRPEWNGQPIAGKTLLIYAEQGAGDTIQMLRYAPVLHARGVRLLVAPQIGLGSVCERMGCFAGIHEDILDRIAKGNVPAYDYQIPAMSLPRVMGTELHNIPPPPSFPTKSWALPDTGRLKVGIVWAGSKDHAHDKWRSTSLANWSGLWELPVDFYSLQVGVRSFDIVAHNAPVIDRTKEIKTFADTADLIAAMDLVIGVDTSVIHLAGTIGKRTWLLNAFSPDWRWLLNRSDSPWYPSIRQFRQVQILDWRWPFAEIKRELASLCYSRAHRN